MNPEALVPREHPLRSIRSLVNAALKQLSRKFDTLYVASGRTSIAPEKLLRALLLQAFFGVRSERQLMEQVTYNMLFRWFIGLSMDAPVEEPFGWIKQAAGLRQTRHRGLARVGWMVTLTAAACNLVRLPKLLAGAA